MASPAPQNPLPEHPPATGPGARTVPRQAAWARDSPRLPASSHTTVTGGLPVPHMAGGIGPTAELVVEAQGRDTDDAPGWA